MHSATSVSTPTEEQPFAVDSLGETVVRLDKAMARLKLAQEQASKDESGELLAKEEVQQEYMVNPKLKLDIIATLCYLFTVAFSTSI